MAILDWVVLLVTLSFIVIYGSWKTKGSKNVKDFIKGGNEAKWWTIGLSVMATQASAITFLSTPGQAFHSGMGFVQFYFGLPLAMIIICMVFIPIYHRLNVYTAYEYLETRFDLKTRSFAIRIDKLDRGRTFPGFASSLRIRIDVQIPDIGCQRESRNRFQSAAKHIAVAWAADNFWIHLIISYHRSAVLVGSPSGWEARWVRGLAQDAVRKDMGMRIHV